MNLRTLTNEALWHLWHTHISMAATIKAELDHRDRVFKPRRNQRSSSRPFNNKHGKRT